MCLFAITTQIWNQTSRCGWSSSSQSSFSITTCLQRVAGKGFEQKNDSVFHHFWLVVLRFEHSLCPLNSGRTVVLWFSNAIERDRKAINAIYDLLLLHCSIEIWLKQAPAALCPIFFSLLSLCLVSSETCGFQLFVWLASRWFDGFWNDCSTWLAAFL